MINTRLKIGDYEAWVVVDNAEVEHYATEINEETKVATCWIASTAGKRFGLWVAKRHNNFDCRARIYLDGSSLREASLRDMKPRLLDSVQVSRESARPFMFGTVNFTDDESFLNSGSYEELGSIKATIYRITDYERQKKRGKKCREVQENDRIHENVKKGVTHRISFGPKINRVWRRVTLNAHEDVATFVFHYRSLDMLKADKIAPCESSCAKIKTQVVPFASTSADRDSVSRKRKRLVTDDEEKLRSLVITDSEDEDKRREDELEAELKSIRKARLHRRQGKHERKPFFLSSEVIDLTI